MNKIIKPKKEKYTIIEERWSSLRKGKFLLAVKCRIGDKTAWIDRQTLENFFDIIE